MNDSHEPLKGALWASAHAQHRHQPMGVFVAAAVVVTVLMIYGLTHVNFAPVQTPPKEMRVTMAPPPPPPPPPPEVKKIEPPPAPTPVEKPKPTPVKPKPLPTPKPPPAKPAPAPKEANIPAAANPTPNAPALATAPANTTPAAPVAAAAAPTPAPAPGLHGVVDGRGHCQSVQPQIPRKALQDGISATVTARLSIGTDGQVSDVKIMRVSPPTSVFNEAVIAAGKGYKCEKNPEPYVGEVQFSFKTTASDDE
ncbi:TonB family protein [Caballeronia sp. dw_276]|uniref:energy transducer TonB n=1 Tax=Caballeronia sp. dw_276 TaxID=2719795 RepID=UPI001BD6A84B|nr:TonB family protein [Caballeronia sp. dw_276]